MFRSPVDMVNEIAAVLDQAKEMGHSVNILDDGTITITSTVLGFRDEYGYVRAGAWA